MVGLKFEIFSFYYPNGNKKYEYKKHSVSKSYDENKIFNDVLSELHDKYKIDKEKKSEYFIPQLTDLMWGQYFSHDVCYHIDFSEDEFLKLKLCDLEKQFNISKRLIPLYLNYQAMGGTVGNVEGVKISFYLNEKDTHHNPHVHCEYSGDKVLIEIKTLKIVGTPFKRSKIDIAKDFIIEHREELLDYWERVIVNGESIKLKLIV